MTNPHLVVEMSCGVVSRLLTPYCWDGQDSWKTRQVNSGKETQADQHSLRGGLAYLPFPDMCDLCQSPPYEAVPRCRARSLGVGHVSCPPHLHSLEGMTYAENA